MNEMNQLSCFTEYNSSFENDLTPEKKIENFYRTLYGDLTRDEIRSLRNEHSEKNRIRLEKVKKAAMATLRRVNRPVRRDDMLATMDVSIMSRLSAYEATPAPDTALMLIATIICKNILIDGPLHENE